MLFADGDNFTSERDATGTAIPPWIEKDKLFDLFPSMRKKAFAILESVSSRSGVNPYRRYRPAFLFDEPITTQTDYHKVLLLLASEFPLIPDIKRSPAQPVFGNARKETSGAEIIGNVLSLKEYLNTELPEPAHLNDHLPIAPQARSLPERFSHPPLQENGNGNPHTPNPIKRDITLDEFIRQHRIPTIKQRPKGGHFVQCPWQANHASGQNTDTDAYIWENDDGTFAFYCSHATCKKQGNSWKAYRETVAPKQQPTEKPSPFGESSPSLDTQTENGKPSQVKPVIEFISLKALEQKEFPPLQWVVDDLIPEGLTVLAGAPKIGKSFFSWNLALAVGQAGVFLSGYKVSKPKNVLYFALDNDPQRQIQSRLKMIQPDESLPSNVQLCTRFPIQLQDQGLETWEETIKAHEADLVIIDTLGKVLSSDNKGTAYEQDYNTLGPVHSMVNRLGISMMLVTHTRKMIDIDNPFNMIQGSVGVQAACDNLMMLTQSDGDKTLHITGREILPIELAVEISQGVFIATSVEDREENKLSDIRGNIMALVKEAGKNGLTMKAIVDSIEVHSQTNIKNTVRRMLQDAQIYQPKQRGKYYYQVPDEFSTEADDISI